MSPDQLIIMLIITHIINKNNITNNYNKSHSKLFNIIYNTRYITAYMRPKTEKKPGAVHAIHRNRLHIIKIHINLHHNPNLTID